jgi:hypothetical protein
LTRRMITSWRAKLPCGINDFYATCGFKRLDLTEELLFFARGISPVGQQPGGRRGHAHITAGPRQPDAATNIVDELVLFDAILSPFRVELKLLTLLLRSCDWDEKYELVRRPSICSSVMPSSMKRKWRVGSSNGELMTGFSITTWLIL